jgi:excisionase family DNA binding protein
VGEDRDTAQDRVTIQEAARRLGVKEDAIRKRIQRGSLAYEKTEEGRVFVWVEATQDTAQDTTEDVYRDTDRDELLAELRDQVRFLREELARKDAILLNMTESMRQLTAPQEETLQETPGVPETATPQPGRVGPQTPLEGTQEPRESSEMHMPEAGGGPLPHDQQTPSERPWWRRMFGG